LAVSTKRSISSVSTYVNLLSCSANPPTVTVLILGAILFVLGVAIACWEISRFRESEYSTFTNQSIQLASVFARSANVWLIRGNNEALEFAANLMLAGSGQYVRIDVGDVTILDERVTGHGIEDLDLTLDLEPSELGGARGSLRSGGLDIVVPITFSDQGNETVGVVQIGFSDTYARAQVRSHRILIFGLIAGSWLLLMLVAVFIVRILHMRSRLAIAQLQEVQPDGIIRCGTLTIDTKTCAATLNDKDLDLTPKTFELLTFLACNEGKTFSDADLLAALWEDAPYAASGDVKQCVYILRRRLAAVHPDPKRIIVNVKGFGYRLEAPTEAVLSPD